MKRRSFYVVTVKFRYISKISFETGFVITCRVPIRLGGKILIWSFMRLEFLKLLRLSAKVL